MAAAQKTILISRGQAEAARLLVEIADRWGEPIPVGVRAMAKALQNAPATAKLDKPLYPE